MGIDDIRAADIGAEYVACRRREVAGAEIDGDVVLYDELQETTHLLNQTGAIVWSLLDGSSRIDEIASELAEAYAAPADAVLADVLALVRELGRRGLLEEACGDPNAIGAPD